MNRRSSGTPDDIHSSQRRGPSRHMMSSGQLEGGFICPLNPSTTGTCTCAPNFESGGAGRRAPVHPPSTGRVITLDARRARRLIRRHGNADWSGRRRALRGKCQPVATPLTRSGPAPPWRRSALRGNEVALERLQLPGCQWPFPATPAAAPGAPGDAADDRHFNRHRSQGIAELAPVGESEGETWGHGAPLFGFVPGADRRAHSWLSRSYRLSDVTREGQ